MRRALALAACALLTTAGSGCYKKKKHKEGAAETASPAAPAKKAVKDHVLITVDDSGFHPDKVPANQGQPITLTFKRTTEKTCATAVVFASEGVNKPLPVDKTVDVPIMPGRGNIRFNCPMNMFTGEIEVQ